MRIERQPVEAAQKFGRAVAQSLHRGGIQRLQRVDLGRAQPGMGQKLAPGPQRVGLILQPEARHLRHARNPGQTPGQFTPAGQRGGFIHEGLQRLGITIGPHRLRPDAGTPVIHVAGIDHQIRRKAPCQPGQQADDPWHHRKQPRLAAIARHRTGDILVAQQHRQAVVGDAVQHIGNRQTQRVLGIGGLPQAEGDGCAPKGPHRAALFRGQDDQPVRQHPGIALQIGSPPSRSTR